MTAKKLLSLLLVSALIMNLLPAFALAAGEENPEPATPTNEASNVDGVNDDGSVTESAITAVIDAEGNSITVVPLRSVARSSSAPKGVAENPYTYSGVTAVPDGDVITVTAKGVRAHYNAAGALGHWAGFGVYAPDGATGYRYSVGSHPIAADAAMNVSAALDKISDTQDGFAWFFGATGEHTAYLKLQFYKAGSDGESGSGTENVGPEYSCAVRWNITGSDELTADGTVLKYNGGDVPAAITVEDGDTLTITAGAREMLFSVGTELAVAVRKGGAIRLDEGMAWIGADGGLRLTGDAASLVLAKADGASVPVLTLNGAAEIPEGAFWCNVFGEKSCGVILDAGAELSVRGGENAVLQICGSYFINKGIVNVENGAAMVLYDVGPESCIGCVNIAGTIDISSEAMETLRNGEEPAVLEVTKNGGVYFDGAPFAVYEEKYESPYWYFVMDPDSDTTLECVIGQNSGGLPERDFTLFFRGNVTYTPPNLEDDEHQQEIDDGEEIPLGGEENGEEDDDAEEEEYTYSDACIIADGRFTIGDVSSFFNGSSGILAVRELENDGFLYNEGAVYVMEKITGSGYIDDQENSCDISYGINVADDDNGTVTVESKEELWGYPFARADETVVLAAAPADGYTFDGFTVTGADNETVSVTDNTFIMPASPVTVRAFFVPPVAADGSGDGSDGTAGDDETGPVVNEGDAVENTAGAAGEDNGYEPQPVTGTENMTGGNGDETRTETTAITDAEGNVIGESTTETVTSTGEDGTKTVTTNETGTATVTDDHGNTAVTETEKSAETVTDADGNVTETTSEKRTTTQTDADGNVIGATTREITSAIAADGSRTERSAEVSTAVSTNGDGSTISITTVSSRDMTTSTAADGTTTTETTNAGTETVTATTIDAGGNETTVSTVTTTEGSSIATLDADGNGTISESTTETVVTTDAEGNETTVITETATETTIETDEAETVTTTAEKIVTVTDGEGNVTEEVTVTTDKKTADGSTGTTVADGGGNLITAAAEISETAFETAVESGEPVQVPIVINPIPAERVDGDYVPTVTLRLPTAPTAPGENKPVSEMQRVRIPTPEAKPGYVAFLCGRDGALSLIKESRVGSVIVPVEGSCELVIVDNTKAFSDLPENYWGEDYVTFVTAREIFNGYEDEFYPEDAMSRAMVAQVLYNLDRGAEAGDASAVFADVEDSDWWNAAVGWANENEIVLGYDGAFNPTTSVTRQELAAMLYRYAQFAGYDVSARADLSEFADADEIADYALEAMQWACAVGIFRGYEDGTIRPAVASTRAVVAVMLRNFVSNAG